MINLLPPEVKEMRMYGRRNRLLLRWSMICMIGAVGLVIIAAGGYFFLNNAEKAAQEQKRQTELAIDASKIEKADKAYVAYSNNLKTVTQILTKQVLFSQLIQEIGAALPPGVTLDTVSLSNKDNALGLDFNASNPNLAATLQINLEDKRNALFDKADIVSVSCKDVGATCHISVRALYKKDANYLFLNSVSSTGAKQ